MRFTSIKLGNYRAWENLAIEFAPITLIFGPNNSGKSAILQALPLLAQTLESADRNVPLLLDGEYLDQGTYGDVVFQNDKRRSITIGFGVEGERADDRRLQRYLKTSPFEFQATFRYRSQRRETVLASSELHDTLNQDARLLLSTRYSSASDSQTILTAIPSAGAARVRQINRRAVSSNHFLVPTGSTLRQFIGTARGFEAARHIDGVQSVLAEALRSLEYLSPYRSRFDRTQLFSGSNPSSVGSEGEWTSDIMATDFFRRGKEKSNILEYVSLWMKKAGLAKSVSIKPLTDRHFEIKAEHPDTGENQNLADVGSGLNQVMPVLVAGMWADPGSTLILEEPEIHLHPRAQAYLGDFIFDLYKRRVQALIETHSEHLLLRVQRLVAEGKIDPKHVAVYYVYSDRKSKLIRRIDLSEAGLFTEEWPEGFFPERLEEARAIIKGSSSRRK